MARPPRRSLPRVPPGEAILDAAPIGILTYDADGRIVQCNPEAARLLGRRRDQLLRLHSSGSAVADFVDDEGAPVARRGLVSAEGDCSEPKGSGSETLGVRLPDGRLRWLQIVTTHVAPLTRAGGRTCWLTDVTAATRREAEADLRSALALAAFRGVEDTQDISQ